MTSDDPKTRSTRAERKRRQAEKARMRLERQAERSTSKTALRMAARLHNEGRTPE
ncbi:hypothetical protein [Paracoccus sp. PAR01]|uniref:hypothetical protein n=1 Tax=Paracoccus sp. PAR01 TaxID=2769282 RepID=UPI00177B6963|nr:hypothetical protein [Paracoccus sp. PAR01]MBD9528990.1 hypothetical protein [Paracoccus sp. PAR01]